VRAATRSTSTCSTARWARSARPSRATPSRYVYREISIRNGHLLRQSPIVSIAWADRPWGLIVMAREDGMLVLGSYSPQEEVINFVPGRLSPPTATSSRSAWCRRSTATRSGCWSSATAAAPSRSMTNLLRDDQPDRLAVNLDSAISTKDARAATLTYVSTDGSGVQTWQASAGVFVAGDVGKAIRVLEAGEPDALNMPTWSARTLRIATVPAADTVTAAVESAAAPTSPVASGDWLVSRTTITDLDLLEGRTDVYLLADGAQLGPYTVTGGAIALQEGQDVWYVTAGLAYPS
jgi:hypothetical protein